MTKSNLYTVLCTSVRLAAIYLFVDAILQLALQLPEGRNFHLLDWYAVLAAPATQIAFAVPLWLGPGALARIAASNKSLEVFESEISPDKLQYLAFSILGIYFVVTGFVQFAYTIHRWLFVSFYLSHSLPDPRADPKVMGTLLSEAARILAGVVLAAGASGLVGILRSIRERGSQATPADPQGD